MTTAAGQGLKWGLASIGGTWYRAMLNERANFDLSFEETVARLKTLSGLDPTENTDQYKVSVEFDGTFNGAPFTLYDYKGDDALHIGGDDRLDVAALVQALRAALKDVQPTSYVATVQYDGDNRQHGWPPAKADEPALVALGPLDKATLLHVRSYIDSLLETL